MAHRLPAASTQLLLTLSFLLIMAWLLLHDFTPCVWSSFRMRSSFTMYCLPHWMKRWRQVKREKVCVCIVLLLIIEHWLSSVTKNRINTDLIGPTSSLSDLINDCQLVTKNSSTRGMALTKIGVLALLWFYLFCYYNRLFQCTFAAKAMPIARIDVQ